METESLDLIRLLVELTKEGKVRWQQVYDYRWEAQAAGQNFYAEFIYLARTDEVGSDRTMARLSAFNLYDFCIGTEGFDLICEMLSIGNEAWTESRAMGKQRLEDGFNLLRKLKA